MITIINSRVGAYNCQYNFKLSQSIQYIHLRCSVFKYQLERGFPTKRGLIKVTILRFGITDLKLNLITRVIDGHIDFAYGF